MKLKSRFTNPIYDNIYGFVYLSKEEESIVESQYFQRLRFISQLGLSHFVFPGAIHTRFSHSIGVLYIVEKMIEQLVRNGMPYNQNFHQIIRLAALLHDIGHFPLSHTIESAYKIDEVDRSSKDSEKELMGNGHEEEATGEVSFLKIMSPDFETEGAKESNHERFSRHVLFSDEFKNLLEPFEALELIDLNRDLDEIYSLIVGDGSTRLRLLSQLVNSNADADQMDYMTRDSHFTGVKIGSFDLDFLIRSLTFGVKEYPKKHETGGSPAEEPPTEEMPVTAFRRQAVLTVEHFLLAKFYWYSQIINHPKVLILEHMARNLYYYLISNHLVPSINELQGWAGESSQWIRFNDRFFWEKVESIISTPGNYPNVIVKLAEALYYKKVPNLIENQERIELLQDEFLNFPDRELVDANQEEDIRRRKVRKFYYLATKEHSRYYPYMLSREVIRSSRDSDYENEVTPIKDDHIRILGDETNRKVQNLIDVKEATIAQQLKQKQHLSWLIYDFEEVLK